MYICEKLYYNYVLYKANLKIFLLYVIILTVG